MLNVVSRRAGIGLGLLADQQALAQESRRAGISGLLLLEVYGKRRCRIPEVDGGELSTCLRKFYLDVFAPR